MKAAAAWRQNGLVVNLSRHHLRQRSTVRRSTPTSPDSRCILPAVAPSRMIAISTTVAARWTLRPRNRNDGGVLRVRQPSRAQQKLKRQSCSSPSPAGRPRGLRRYWAECTTLPHSRHRPRRAAMAMSRSKTRSSSWNVASASKVEYKGCVLLGSRSLTTMAKPRRNDPCPCGSGNKYKKCCLAKEEAVEREQLAKAEARRAESAAAHRLQLGEVRAAIAARLSGAEDADDDELTIASNAAAGLVRAGKLDEAEQAARDLLVLFPDVHDGYDRLGMVYEARGENRQAAECYRKVIAFIREHPDDYDPNFEDVFVKLVDRLDPPV